MPQKSYFKNSAALALLLVCAGTVLAQFSTCSTTLLDAHFNPAGYQRLFVPGQPCSVYYYSTTNKTGLAAHQDATALGVQQLVVESAAENADVINALNAQGVFPANSAVWLGITDSPTVNAWHTFSNVTQTYFNWTAGEPNNQKPPCYNAFTQCLGCSFSDPYWCQWGEDCAVLENTGLWKDLTCNSTLAQRVPVMEINTCPVITKPVDQSICAGNSATLSTSFVSGGTGPFSYTWSPGGQTGTSITVSPTTLTTYTVEIADRFACKADSTATVNVSGTAVTPTIQTSQAATCKGVNDTITLSTTPATATYNWNFSSATVISGNNGGPYILSWGTGGVKAISVTVTDGSCPSQATTNVTVNSADASFALNPATTACATQNVTVTLTNPASGTATYNWNFGGATVASGSVGGPYSISWGSPGGKTVAVTVTDNGCTDTASRSITIANAVNNAFTFNPTSGCANQPVAVALSGASSATATYVWNFGGGTVASGSGAGPYSIIWATGGSKTVTLSVTDGGCGAQSTNNFTVNSASAAFTLNPATTACTGQNVTATLNTPVSGTAVYTWNFNGANIVSGTTGGPYTINWPAAGVQTVSLIANDNGCADTFSTTITVSSSLSPTFTTTPAGGACAGQVVAITLNGTASPTATYTWNFNGGTTLSGSGAGPYSVSWSNSGITSIDLTVTDGGCTGNATVPFTISTPPAAMAGSNQTICSGGSITLGAATTGSVYSWSPAANLNDSTLADPVFHLSNSTNAAITTPYTLTVDSAGCKSTATIQVTTNAPGVATITAGGATSFCAGGSVVLQDNDPAHTGYSWSTVATTSSITVTTAGSVSLSATDAAGCEYKSTNPVTVTVYPNPAVALAAGGQQNESCYKLNDGQLTADATGGTAAYRYTWNTTPQQSGATISNLAPGSYMVTVADSHGCRDSNTYTILAATYIGFAIDSVRNVSCYKGADGAVYLHTIGAPQPGSFIWSNGSRDTFLTNLKADTLSVTFTDTSGCIADTSVIITQPSKITIIPTGTLFIEYGEQTRLDLSITPATSYFYSWSPPTALSCIDCASPIAAPLQTTAYTVSVTDAKGCHDTATIMVIIDPGKAFYIPNAFTPNNDGKNDNFLVYARGTVKFYEIDIFDRWGEKVYQSYDINRGWDGSYNGVQVNNGTYVYQSSITFGDGQTFNNKGTITVFR